jgi:hypothetical protein
MDLLESTEQRVANPRRALDSPFSGVGGFASIESLAGDGIGEFRQRPTVINFGLSALDLELVKNPCKLGDLLLVQVELVGEEAQGPSHAEPRSPFEPISLVMRVAVAAHEPPSWLTMMVMTVVFMGTFMFGLVMGMSMRGVVVARIAP